MNAIACDHPCPCATDGQIAAINLESARRRAWARFAQDPRRPGLVEEIVDKERLALQFLGDLDALDRLDALAVQFARVDDSSRAALVHAEVASTVHRFDDARDHLARAALMGAPSDAIECHSLTIDQACGVELDEVLAARHRIAAASDRLEDRVPLAAVLADLERFSEADAVYRQALYSYDGISPFAPAWVCFQLGLLWGELVPLPDQNLAALWYRRAIAYLPGYVTARVHLSEIYASQNQAGDAEALLEPALSSRDPEVRWRLADVLIAQERFEEAKVQLTAARCGFDELLRKHLLAFADHAAEFYAGSGNDLRRALDLARTNVANRPTCRAIEQARAIATTKGSAMKQKSKLMIALAAAALVTLSGTVVYAQDKYSLQTSSGIAFSDFKGYEDWAVVSSARTDEVLKSPSDCGHTCHVAVKAKDHIFHPYQKR